MIAMQIFVKVGAGENIGKSWRPLEKEVGRWKAAPLEEEMKEKMWRHLKHQQLSSVASWHMHPRIFPRTSIFNTNLQSDQHMVQHGAQKRQSSLTGCCLVEELGATWLYIATGYPRSITVATDKTHISCSPVNDSFWCLCACPHPDESTCACATCYRMSAPGRNL